MITAVVVLTTRPASAENIYPYVDEDGLTGTTTRAEIRAEFERAYAEGHPIAANTPEFVEFTRIASSLSRGEIVDEALQAARTEGKLPVLGS